MGMLGALVLQQLRGSGKRGGAVHAGMQRQMRSSSVLLLLLGFSVLMAADLRTGGKRASAGQAGNGSRQLCRAGQLRAGNARRYGAVVVMEVMVGVGVGKGGVCAFLTVHEVRAGLYSSVATEAGKHGERSQRAC